MLLVTGYSESILRAADTE